MPSAEAATEAAEAVDFGALAEVAGFGVAVEVVDSAVAEVADLEEAVRSEAAVEVVCFGAAADLEAVAGSGADAMAVTGTDTGAATGSFSDSAILPGIGLPTRMTRTSMDIPIMAIHILTHIHTVIPMAPIHTSIILTRRQQARPVPDIYREIQLQRLHRRKAWPGPMANGITSASARAPEEG